jgi:hypothetical protein
MKRYTIPRELLDSMATELGLQLEWRSDPSSWSRVVGQRTWKRRSNMYAYLYRIRKKVKNEEDTLV